MGRPRKNNRVPDKFTTDWLESMDGRTRTAQIVSNRFDALVSDLGGSLSYQRRSLCKRCVWLECIIEQMELSIARGEDVDLGRMTQATNTLIGLMKTVGLDRVSRDVTLTDYINGGASK